MVYYTDETPGVNKRLVAGYYLFLCLIGFAILLGPTGSGIPITIFNDRVREAHELATPDFGDNDSLSCTGTGCHDATWDYWNQSVHSGNLITYDPITDTIEVNGHRNRTYAEFNATCAQCHAHGWSEARNATDWPNTHDGFGSTCLSCHDQSTPYYTVDGSNCASCHIHEGHGGLDGWTESAHANSLTDLRGSSHAGSECMHCMSVEGFLDQEADLDPDGPYNPLTCPACHSVHSADVANPSMIRAVNATELCGLCHTGGRHSTYDVWKGGAHDLTGIVECTSCHGYREGSHGPEMNHTFSVLPEDACNQTDCHEGQLDWAINQLEEIQSSYDALVADFNAEATAFETVVMDYNATADADYELVDYVLGIVDEASTTVGYYGFDGSSGFHDPMETFDALNDAFRDLLDAKAYFYENLPEPTTPPPVGGFDTLIVVGGAAGGIVVGLLLGVLVGRRR
ncbi:MAG: ammonia-forming cytochrome c nitrite reductase subunit c552 [Candidatus Thorarchaeota archaeon]